MRTKAIILKKTRAHEHDEMIHCYSEDFGSMRMIARGILRPTSVQSMHLDVLNLVEFEVIHGRSAPIIAGAQMIDQFVNIKTELPRLAAAQFFAEVLDRVAFENEKDPVLWNFLLNTLQKINQSSEQHMLSLFRSCQAEFLSVLGYQPQVQRCVVCAIDPMTTVEDVVALSPELGGVLCSNCFLEHGRGVLFSKADLQVLAKNEYPVFATMARSPLDTFFEYTLGQKLLSLDFMYAVV